MRFFVFDMWRVHDDADFGSFLGAMRDQGHEVVDVYVSPDGYASMDDWAGAIAAQIEATVRSGDQSVKLLGYCVGGRVACRVAEDLTSVGMAPSYVGVIEAWQRNAYREYHRFWYRRMKVDWNVRWRQQLLWLALEPEANLRKLLFVRLRDRVKAILDFFTRGPARRWRERQSEWTMLHLTQNCMYPTVHSFVHLYNTESTIGEFGDDPSLGLAAYLRGGFSVRRISGDHHSCTKLPARDSLIVQIAIDARRATE